ncbi:COX15/CtaA family protein [Chitinophaga sancti]|uniref:COX15/CtaA family protein n=1 Tax=Chitinophaga sancti TaxID=1004 RepID=A0A1K1SUG5_9BACT|nr:COX15/CtaA family protein [Chitinophaga sancti]WQD60542.1 COX15/CtaA family protein [Chitinophaga sancti]WQG87331.1 COX15/CtaA family protein [Chitinophaga sancti]SFW87955.1 cytochrome c oxidase assembly protein subunit 15 [Chitinophaga sancti]
MDRLTTQQQRPVAIWLYIGVGMLIIQVLLGGITRLTGSGLSITEWKPILGAFPPMNEAAWVKAFDKYKEIGQAKYLNNHFTLSDFKGIFFWEWLHRDWARLMGGVFLVGFVYFLIKRKIDRSMIKPMIILFLLGGLQAAIGWIMVQSGLNEDNLYVNHIRLAIHFLAALSLLVYVLWFALKLSTPVREILLAPGLRKLNGWLLGLLSLQLFFGALMAGLHAALAASTWPDINGAWIPGNMFTQGNFLQDLTHNTQTIHFVHRNLAYLITILVVIWWWKAASETPEHSLLHRVRYLPLLLVLVQVLLGVLTLLGSQIHIPILQAILHQGVGMLLLLVLVWTYFLSYRKK